MGCPRVGGQLRLHGCFVVSRSVVEGLAGHPRSNRELEVGSCSVGSTIGNMVPMLWGGDAMSISGFFFSLVGGIAGIWVGYRWARSF